MTAANGDRLKAVLRARLRRELDAVYPKGAIVAQSELDELDAAVDELVQSIVQQIRPVVLAMRRNGDI